MAKNTTERAKDKLTRKKAEKLISGSFDLGFLNDERFLKHANKHVKAKAAYKIAKLEAAAA